MEFLIVSGLSGAGKSTVMSILEDSGYFCMDNLPPALIPKFAEMCLSRGGSYEKSAIVCDVRGGTSFDGLFDALKTLRAMDFGYKILFVEAETETIIKRYKETRRSHPLMGEGKSLIEVVEQEREIMAPVRKAAHHIVTTTELPTKKLRDVVLELCQPDRQKERLLSVSVSSFGFKYGLPLEADLVFDVRFLPNPFYVAELRSQTGLDHAVREYVFSSQPAAQFMEHLKNMIAFLLPHFVEEGKSALMIAIGCTGGHHRSVAITHEIAEYIRTLGYEASETHLDIARV